MSKAHIVYHPGLTLRDEIDSRAKTCKCCGHIKQYTTTQFAKDSGMAQSQVSQILHGKRNITPLMAKRIAKALGTSATMWVKMQMNYDLWLLDRK